MRWNIDPAAILTPQELESLELAEELYAARGKISAEQLGQVIGLDDETREKFVGAVGLTLSNLDFEKRREVARKMDEASARFDEIIAIIGGTASEERGVVTAPSESTSKARSEFMLNETQRTWLSKLYDEKGVERIGAAHPQQRDYLASRLSETYSRLPIPRITSDGKARRVGQIKELVAGKDLHEMSEDMDVNFKTLYAGVMKAAESIQTRVSAIQLDKVLDDMEAYEINETAVDEYADVVEHETQAEINAPTELRADQVRWLNRMIEDPPIDVINNLNPEQRDYLTTRLSWRLAPALLKKFGKFGSDQRVATMTRFMQGDGILEIADDRGVSPEAIRQELIHAADRLKSTVPKEDLLKFVEEAQTFEPIEE